MSIGKELSKTRILGIETSCDETGAAVVRGGREILSNIVVSSLKEHQKFGGVIPEIAARRQLEFITAVVDRALLDARVRLSEIDAVAVTHRPGLIGPLLVGLSFARAVSFAQKKPLVPVDHIQAHLYANFLSFRTTGAGRKADRPPLPAVGLIVSGGHTSLYKIRDVRHFELLGQTRDDAAGEAFDKVARILGLGYPGGPAIDRLAAKVKKTSLRFPCALLPDSFDFSFSGIKTSVLYYTRDHARDKNFSRPETAYAFQESLVSVLAAKCVAACRKCKIKTLLVGGGVAANSRLREQLKSEAEKFQIRVFVPPLSLCVDNGAMIAGLGAHDKGGSRRGR